MRPGTELEWVEAHLLPSGRFEEQASMGRVEKVGTGVGVGGSGLFHASPRSTTSPPFPLGRVGERVRQMNSNLAQSKCSQGFWGATFAGCFFSVSVPRISGF